MQVSYHAQRRQARRNLSNDDVTFVLCYGRHLYRAGALHVFLGRRDIPNEREIIRRYGHLEGTVLILDDTSSYPTLITIYRNRRGFKGIRAKSKYESCGYGIPRGWTS